MTKQLSLQCCNYLKPIYWNSNFQTLRGHYGRSMRHYINSANEVLIWNCTRENSIWTSHGINNVGRQMTDFCSIMLTSLVQKESICSCSCSSGCYSSRTTGKRRDQCIAVLYLCIFAVSEEISYSHPSFAFRKEKVIPRVLVTYNFSFLQLIDSTSASFVKQRLRGTVISAYHYSKGNCKDDGDKGFSIMGKRPELGGSDWVSGNDSSLAE